MWDALLGVLRSFVDNLLVPVVSIVVFAVTVLIIAKIGRSGLNRYARYAEGDGSIQTFWPIAIAYLAMMFIAILTGAMVIVAIANWEFTIEVANNFWQQLLGPLGG